MKKVYFGLITTLLALSLTGCGSSGGGTSGQISSLPNAGTTSDMYAELATSDLAAIETALMANRIEVVQGNTGPNASIQADKKASGSSSGTASDTFFRHRGGSFHRGSGPGFPPPPPPPFWRDPFDASASPALSSASQQLASDGHEIEKFRRGPDGCPFGMDNPASYSSHLLIASAVLTVEKLGETSYRIIRPNGTEVKVERPAGNIVNSTIEVEGITWSVVFGTTASEPLAILTNTQNSRVLRISEDDNGNLILIAGGGHRFHGKWNPDGTIELNDESENRQYRFSSSK